MCTVEKVIKTAKMEHKNYKQKLNRMLRRHSSFFKSVPVVNERKKRSPLKSQCTPLMLQPYNATPSVRELAQPNWLTIFVFDNIPHENSAMRTVGFHLTVPEEIRDKC